MASPIKIDDIKVGAVLEGKTASSKRRQVRKVLSVGKEHRNFVEQLNDDCCQYLIVEGFGSGKTGRCSRMRLFSWAEKVIRVEST